MFYTRLRVTCHSDFVEILIAEIAEVGFDSFLETDDGFEAYVEEERFDNSLLYAVREKYRGATALQFSIDRIEKKNWNEEWENSLEPIVVENKCLIRAEFHKPERAYPYEIIITPKMSFGTGHHQTTYLMVKAQLDLDHTDKRVMDAGCGTAILSIMASKCGARSVDAFDIDEWSVINGQENITNNGCTNIRLRQGKITELEFSEKFEIILANINKNILLEEMNHYANHLCPGGLLLLSGFYQNDADDLMKRAGDFGLHYKAMETRDSWASLLLEMGNN